jgi:hypothetical protein
LIEIEDVTRDIHVLESMSGVEASRVEKKLKLEQLTKETKEINKKIIIRIQHHNASSRRAKEKKKQKDNTKGFPFEVNESACIIILLFLLVELWYIKV